MKIAFLSWSATAAQPGWQNDGPYLPIEFDKRSDGTGWVPLLCDSEWAMNVPTLWRESTLDDECTGRHDLAQREGVADGEIGCLKRDEVESKVTCFVPLKSPDRREKAIEQINRWMDGHREIEWIMYRCSATQAQFLNESQFSEATRQVTEDLKVNDAHSAAAACTQRVPPQIWTPLRAVIEATLDAPLKSVIPVTSWTPISSVEDLRLKDWQECRTTIGRLDSILLEFRKIGFSLITGLLTASAFLGKDLNAAASGAAVFIAIMVLVAALFSVDTHYQVLLSGAVQRALDLESLTVPHIRITKYLSVNSTKSRVNQMVLVVYLALLATAAGLGLLTARAEVSLTPTWAREVAWWAWLWVAVLLRLLTAIIVIMLRSNGHRPSGLASGETLHTVMLWLVGFLLVLTTAGIAAILWVYTKPAVPEAAVALHLVMAVSVVLGAYIEVYWLFIAHQSHLHRESPDRKWPEGNWDVLGS